MISFVIFQRVALAIEKFSKAVKVYIMEYQGVASQNYYNHTEEQLANASYDPNSYFASSRALMLMLLAVMILDMLHRLILLLMFLIIHIIIINIMAKSRCML